MQRLDLSTKCTYKKEKGRCGENRRDKVFSRIAIGGGIPPNYI
jgi:hypothetical protein